MRTHRGVLPSAAMLLADWLPAGDRLWEGRHRPFHFYGSLSAV